MPHSQRGEKEELHVAVQSGDERCLVCSILFVAAARIVCWGCLVGLLGSLGLVVRVARAIGVTYYGFGGVIY